MPYSESSYVMYGSAGFMNVAQLLSSLWSDERLALQCGKHVRLELS